MRISLSRCWLAPTRLRVALLLVLGMSVSSAKAVAQAVLPGRVVFPDGGIFRPLLADPQRPQFFAKYFWTRSPRLGAQTGSVGFGRDIGFVRLPSGRWQLSLAAGVFSQFNMDSKSSDLLGVDYIVGFPITHRRGRFSARLQLYHQSSHLGDEFILHSQAQRVDLTYEAVELLLSDEIANWRLYGGGEYLFNHQPRDLKPGRLHAGVEYRQTAPLVRLGRFGDGRLVAALDGKSFQDRNWHVGWTLHTGLAFTPTSAAAPGGGGWSVLLEAYGGPAPFGQFFRENISSVGLGLAFDL